MKSGVCACGCGQRTRIAFQTDNAIGQKMGQPRPFVKGHNRRGVTMSPESRKKISDYRRSFGPSGKNHPLWKGDEVGYTALHFWVYRNKMKKGRCSTCSFTGDTEWANISGVYLRDLDDFAEMCKACHTEFDNFNDQFMEGGDRKSPKGRRRNLPLTL